MNSPHVDVLVVGAGPVGLTAAAELRRRGVAVRCVDAAHHHNVSTKPLGLQARTLELESLRWQLEVNVVGQVAVTQAFLPMLRQARGRVAIIGSIGDRFTPPIECGTHPKRWL